MNKLTLRKDNRRIKSLDEVIAFEKEAGITFPQNLREFIVAYEGSQLKEKYFRRGDILHEIHTVLYLRESDLGGASVEAILKGHRYYKKEGFVPFGVDSGGWDYNVSIKPETYGQIWVDQFDNGEDNPWEFVCNSLEELVEGLSEDE